MNNPMQHYAECILPARFTYAEFGQSLIEAQKSVFEALMPEVEKFCMDSQW